MNKDILTLIKYTYGLLQVERCQFKEYIKAMILRAGFKQCNTDPCQLYILNKLGTVIVIVYVDDMLTIKDKLALINMIECIKK